MGKYSLILIFVLLIILFFNYNISIKRSYKRLYDYNTKAIRTDFGKMTYMDEGTGEPILISHGTFGGYDQGLISLQNLAENDYRKIAPSRFGYPGSDLPTNPSPENQAKTFLHLLDELGISKTYLITTSAGSAPGIMFASMYPERLKGLILLPSTAPTHKKNPEEIKGMTGPPSFLVNDFLMWFVITFFAFVFNFMFGSTIDKSVHETMPPVNFWEKA